MSADGTILITGGASGIGAAVVVAAFVIALSTGVLPLDSLSWVVFTIALTAVQAKQMAN